MFIEDTFTRAWAESSNAGRRCVDLCRESVDFLGLDAARESEDVIVETNYGRLPSGDYGRGDVRRVLRAVIEAQMHADLAAAFWPSGDKGGLDRETGGKAVDAMTVGDLARLLRTVWKPGHGGRGPTFAVVVEHLAERGLEVSR